MGPTRPFAKLWDLFTEYDELPPEVARLFRTDDIRTARYDTNYPLIPARVMVADVQGIESDEDIGLLETPQIPESRRF
jgi:hypothetical protein